MIKLLKKVAFCSNSLLKTALFSFGFASKSSVEFHKAVLASKIISTIRKSPLNDYRSESFPSLKQRIFQEISKYETEINSSTDENLVNQAAKEIRNCFDDGVYVPQYMCSQNRNTENLQGYKLITNEKGQIEILNVKETDKNQLQSILFRKLSFVPTYVITGQIFRKIFQETNYNLLTGQYGVGKTYAFILYTLLSEIIFRYRHQLHSSGNRDLPNEINFKIPKAVYLSMNLSQRNEGEDTPDQKIKQIFKLQCYELKALWQNYDIFKLPKGLYYYYNLKFSTKTVFLNDQINEAASIERKLLEINMMKAKLFSELDQLRGKQKKASIQQSSEIQNKIKDVNGKIEQALEKYNDVRKIHQKAQIYVNKIKELSNQQNFPRILYLSSVDIEKDLLDNLLLMGESKQGNIHSRIRRLDYPISLYGNIAIADTCELFAINLKILWEKIWNNQSEKKIQLPKEQLQMLLDIKKQLNIAMREKLYVFVLPLKIKQYMDQIMDHQNSSTTSDNSQSNLLKNNSLTFESFHKCNKNQLNQKLHDLVERIQSNSIKSMQEKFTKFLNKEIGNTLLTNLKILLSFRLWAQAENTLRQVGKQLTIKDQSINNEMANSITRLKGSYQISINDFEQLLRNPESKKAISEIFFRNHSTQKYFTTCLNPEVIRSAFYINRGIYYKKLLAGSLPLFDYVNEKLAVLGNFLQGNIITMLKKGQTTFSIISNKPNQYQTIEYSKIYYNPSCFVPIPKKNMKSYNDYYFLKSFKIHFQTLMKGTIDSNRTFAWNLLLPLIVSSQTNIDQFIPPIIKRGIQKNQVDIYSKLIDFSLCQLLKLSKIVKIHLFDVTVEKDFMDKKFVSFLTEFSKFKDRNQLSLTIGSQNYKIELYYNLITTEAFNNDFESYVKKTIQNLEKNSKGKDQQLNALKCFRFKNYAGGCQVQGVDENFCLSMIRIISTAQDKLEMKSKVKQIEYDEQIFKRVVQEVKKVRG